MVGQLGRPGLGAINKGHLAQVGLGQVAGNFARDLARADNKDTSRAPLGKAFAELSRQNRPQRVGPPSYRCLAPGAFAGAHRSGKGLAQMCPHAAGLVGDGECLLNLTQNLRVAQDG